MMEGYSVEFIKQGASVRIEIDPDVVSIEALLKTTYSFSRYFHCDIRRGESKLVAVLKAKSDLAISSGALRDELISHALDFALRERVNLTTAGIRDLLLAKAFSESGVLESVPEGVFGDMLEEAKPYGMFKILNNG